MFQDVAKLMYYGVYTNGPGIFVYYITLVVLDVLRLQLIYAKGCISH